jgi:hypothetical protein
MDKQVVVIVIGGVAQEIFIHTAMISAVVTGK